MTSGWTVAVGAKKYVVRLVMLGLDRQPVRDVAALSLMALAPLAQEKGMTQAAWRGWKQIRRAANSNQAN